MVPRFVDDASLTGSVRLSQPRGERLRQLAIAELKQQAEVQARRTLATQLFARISAELAAAAPRGCTVDAKNASLVWKVCCSGVPSPKDCSQLSHPNFVRTSVPFIESFGLL